MHPRACTLTAIDVLVYLQFLSHCWGSADSRKPLTDAIYFALKEHGLRVWCVPGARHLSLRVPALTYH